MENPGKKQITFGHIEDVVSAAALLRPTLSKAIAELDPAQLAALHRALISAEKELANSRIDFRERFTRSQEMLKPTFAFAPIWRFISARIEESWKTSPTLTVKELSVMSLFFGMMFEEVQSKSGKKPKRVA